MREQSIQTILHHQGCQIKLPPTLLIGYYQTQKNHFKPAQTITSPNNIR